MKRIAGLTVVALIGVGAAVSGGPALARTDQPRAAAPARAHQSPHRVTSYTTKGGLSAVAATSPHDAWVVGNSGKKTLIAHWNGKVWKRVSSPSPAPQQYGPYGLLGVAATSPSNAWAVGAGADNKTVILHWNGTAWSQVASPTGSLTAVAATSTTNAWAVGALASSTGQKPLILHWNGKVWAKVSSPGGGYLSSVAVSSRTNAWAVGSTKLGKNLALHWNGKTWSHVHTPSIDAEDSLNHVAIVSARNAWAVGYASVCGCGPGVSLVEHWNGKKWKRVHAPTPGGGTNLNGLAMISASRMWVVGDTGSGDGPTKTLTLRRSGTTWKHVASPNPRKHGYFTAVAVVSGTDAWAVGSSYLSPAHAAGVRKSYKTMILHWNGTAWK
jgi:hypothetical protein